MAAFINILGFPAGAKVFINDEEIGIAPIYYKMLKWGKYKVRIEKEGYEPEVREEFVVWKSDRKKTIYYNLHKIS